MHIALRLHGVMPAEIGQASFQRFRTIARQAGLIALSHLLEHPPRAADGFSEESVNRKALTSRGKVFAKAGAAGDNVNDLGETRSEERRVGKECRSRWS